MANTTFVNLTVSGTYTSVHIRQFVTGEEFNGSVKVNSDGLFLSTEEFACLMFQLRAIEQSLYEKSKNIVAEAEQGEEPTTAIAIAAGKREHSKDESAEAIVKPKRTKKQDELALWYAKSIKSKIDELIMRDCFGCMMNLMDQHKCELPSITFLDEYFDKAIEQVDDGRIYKELKKKNRPSKTELLANENWCNEVKEIIKTL